MLGSTVASRQAPGRLELDHRRDLRPHEYPGSLLVEYGSDDRGPGILTRPGPALEVDAKEPDHELRPDGQIVNNFASSQKLKYPVLHDLYWLLYDPLLFSSGYVFVPAIESDGRNARPCEDVEHRTCRG